MNGHRMSREDVEAALGCRFAGHVFAAAGSGTWITGRVVAWTPEPTVTIEHEDGSQHSYVISTIKDWAAEEKAPF